MRARPHIGQHTPLKPLQLFHDSYFIRLTVKSVFALKAIGREKSSISWLNMLLILQHKQSMQIRADMRNSQTGKGEQIKQSVITLPPVCSFTEWSKTLQNKHAQTTKLYSETTSSEPKDHTDSVWITDQEFSWFNFIYSISYSFWVDRLSTHCRIKMKWCSSEILRPFPLKRSVTNLMSPLWKANSYIIRPKQTCISHYLWANFLPARHTAETLVYLTLDSKSSC